MKTPNPSIGDGSFWTEARDLARVPFDLREGVSARMYRHTSRLGPGIDLRECQGDVLFDTLNQAAMTDEPSRVANIWTIEFPSVSNYTSP